MRPAGAPRLISFAPSPSFLHLFPSSCPHCWGPSSHFGLLSKWFPLLLAFPFLFSPITSLSSPYQYPGLRYCSRSPPSIPPPLETRFPKFPLGEGGITAAMCESGHQVATHASRPHWECSGRWAQIHAVSGRKEPAKEKELARALHRETLGSKDISLGPSVTCLDAGAKSWSPPC